jgi:hypothetical protein
MDCLHRIHFTLKLYRTIVLERIVVVQTVDVNRIFILLLLNFSGYEDAAKQQKHGD